MSNTTNTFTVADPKTFDGDPYEVAERAVLQAGAVAAVLKGCFPGVRTMVRNAEMERQLALTGECDAAEFESSVQARKLDEALKQASEVVKTLEILSKAASFNPKKAGR